MGHWHSREELTHETVRLHKDGFSNRAIARALGISRNTVKDILARHGWAYCRRARRWR